MPSIKECYLSIFVLFFQIGEGQWPSFMNADAHKGAGGVSILEGLILVSGINLAQVWTGHMIHLELLYVILATIILFGMNHYILIFRGYGLSFKNEFVDFPAKKKFVFRLVSIIIVLLSMIVFFYSAVTYRHVFFGM